MSGEWSRPYRETGYQVAHIDLQNWHMPCDVMQINIKWFDDFDLCDIWGVLAALPCTDFAVSGARWFAQKDADGRTAASIRLARQTLAMIEFLRPAWWALENPVGRLNRLVPQLAAFGPWYWQPCEFGDPWTKKTGLWGEFNRDTQAYSLACTGGVVSTTGIAGLTLGGGLGWLLGTHGLSIDNLRSVELVTAEGEIVFASANEHQDLFWGLRGGGGNFGVAASFEYGLHPVGPIVYGGPVLHPFAAAEACGG